jgi:hypothetical protein
MKKKIFLSIILVIGIGIYLRMVIPPKSKGPEKNEDIIWKMFSSAKLGNTQQYLDCFTGKSLRSLQTANEEKGEPVFRDYIQQNAQAIKGVSIINKEQKNSLKTVFDVEIVYADRNEYQTFSLQKAKKGWKINEISKSVNVKQPIPYMEQVVKE